MKKCFTLKVKIWKVMKICSIQAVIAMTLCSMALAHDNYGQVLDKKITISLKEVSIEEALEAIEDLTYVKFFYSLDQLAIKDKVSLEAEDKSLGDVLDELLTPYRIKYKVHERKSAITLKRQQEEWESGDKGGARDEVRAIGPYLVGTITGRVTDAATQQPMAGVNIIIKGTTNGTSSDVEGFYTINAENSDILVFSFIGYKTIEESVDGRSVIDVVLEEDIATLEEVTVNAGYWQVKERENTGNIAKVTAKEIEGQPVTTTLQALSGRMPGVVVRQRSGVPGAGIDIQIRGQNSLRPEANNPLYIVDGVPYPSLPLSSPNISGGIFSSEVSPINYINPSDIESIEILKDADATAIYGSRGANGVVLITTKNGRSKKTGIDINHYAGIGEVNSRMNLLNPAQYREMVFEALKNDGFDPVPEFIKPLLPDLFAWDSTRSTNWQDAFLGGTAKYYNTQISIAGGNSNTHFLISGTYFRQSTVFPGDFALQRGSAHFNLSHRSTNQKFAIGLTLNDVAERNTLPREDFTSVAIRTAPHAPKVFNDEGHLNFENFPNNPFAGLFRKYEAKTRNLISNITMEYWIMRDLAIKANLGYSNTVLQETSVNPMRAKDPGSNPTGSTVFGNSGSETWIIEPQAEYSKRIGHGELTLLIGTTFQSTIEESKAIAATGYTSDALIKNINAAPNIDIQAAGFSKYKYSGLFGRLNYNLKNKYIVNITGRRDGSSRFGPGNQFANFGALGAAWLFSNEQFLDNNVLSFGKLRVSYGTTGSDQIGNYEYLDTHSATNYSYLNTVGLLPTRLANFEFGWETNIKLEGGVELSFLKDKFLLSASYYRNRSANQLVGIPLAGTTGFNSIQSNFPATVENRGWEFIVTSKNIQASNIQWTTSLNLTIPKNELIEFSRIETSSFANTYTVGKSLFNKKRYRYIGVDSETGVYTFEDLNNDGELTNEDLQSIIEVAPKYFGGIQNRLIFEGFEVNFLLQFVKQTGIDFLASFGQPGSPANFPVEILDRWQQTNDIAQVQRYSILSSDAAQAFSYSRKGTNIVADASFIRLQNASLSYTLPSVIIGKLPVQDLRVYILGQNLFTITDYTGLDPETQNSQVLPPLLVLTAGIQLRF